MAEMRKCKECGKLFLPKGREKYCSDIHYRPCPCCGTPVIAKYLSDPARKCDKCKRIKNTSISQKSLFTKNKEESVSVKEEKKEVDARLNLEIASTIDSDVYCETASGTVRRYLGPVIKGSFIPNHDYLLHVEKGEYTYNVSATEDLTSGEDVDIFRNFSSQISINQHFVEIVKEAS